MKFSQSSDDEKAKKMYRNLYDILYTHFHDSLRAYDALLEFIIVDFSPRFIFQIEDKLKWLFFDPELAKGILEIYNPKILKASKRDHLGQLYMEIQSKSSASAKGQFLTPFHVSQMIAQMLMGDEKAECNVLEPCCGTGSMVIAAHSVNPNATYFAVDIDLRATRTCLVNFAIQNIRGYVLCADSLRDVTDISIPEGRENWKSSNSWNYPKKLIKYADCQSVKEPSPMIKEAIERSQRTIADFS